MHKTRVQIFLYLAVVLLMANVSSIVALFRHPRIPYFDPEHLITGGITALVTAILFGLLLIHTNKISATIAELNRANTILHEQTIRDGLTGLYNHRYFHEMLRHEFLLAQRHNADLACLMLDLDLFKNINDTCGHPFGDHVLAGTAKQILGETRATDTVARYGGEEFAVLLPSTDQAGALAIAERIRARNESYIHRQDHHAKKVTVSIGLATLKANAPDNPAQLLNFADQALYQAKKAGRNKVVPYDGKPS